MIKNNTGLSNRSKEYHAKRAIFKALSDRQWHQTIELKASTKLSSATIAKHLREMSKTQLIERKEDLESGKYPVPVFYKASNELMEYITSCNLREIFKNSINGMIDETKDPLVILESIHLNSQLWFLEILKEMKSRKDMKAYEITWLEQIFLFESYEQMISQLIAATDKIIDQIDFDQMIFAQAARNKELSEMVIEGLAKTLITNNPEAVKQTGLEPNVLLRELTAEIAKRSRVQDYQKSQNEEKSSNSKKDLPTD